MKTRNMPRTKEARKEAALKRQEERAKRSAQDQLERLDLDGFAAVKERARLSKEIK